MRGSRQERTSRLYLKIEFLKRGLTIAGVARRVGCSRGHLSRVIQGRAELDDKLARDIALATGIPKVIVQGDAEIPPERPQGGAEGPPSGKGDQRAPLPRPAAAQGAGRPTDSARD